MRIRKAIFLLGILFCSCTASFAQTPRPVELADGKVYQLHRKAGFLEDPEAQFTLEDIEGHPLPSYTATSTQVDSGIDAYWFHLSFTYHGASQRQDFYLLFNQYIDTVTLYIENEQKTGYETVVSGAALPLESQSVPLHGQKKPILPLSVSKGDTVSVYGRMVYSSYLAGEMGRVHFHAVPINTYLTEKAEEQFLRGNILGPLCLMLVLNIILLGYYRERVQLFFVINLFFSLVFYLFFFGFHQFLFPIPSWLPTLRMMDLTIGGLGVASFLLFMHDYLKPCHKGKMLGLITAGLGGMILLNMAIGWMTSYRMLNNVQFSLGMLVSGLAIILSFRCVLKGYKPALYFLIAISVSVLGMMLFALSNLRLIGDFSFTEYVLPIGELFRSLFFTIGILSQHRFVKKQLEQKKLEQERLKTRQKELFRDLLKKKNEELEREVKSRTEELQKQKKELESSNLVKDKLFSIISHDLRSPLAALDGLLQLMRMKFLSEEEMEEMLDGMRLRLKKTQDLVDNLLLWARSQMKGMVAKPQIINLREITQSVMSILEAEQQAKKIEIANELSPKLVAWADRDMIQLVIRNLLANALKFTPFNGRIIFSGGRKNDKVYMEISDTGVGIDKENLDKILGSNEFFSTKGTNNEEGTGLGLVVCQEFIRTNGGDISVTSEEGKGATFQFTLPHASQLMQIAPK